MDIDDCSGGHEPRPQVPAAGEIVGPLSASAHGDRRVLPHEANGELHELQALLEFQAEGRLVQPQGRERRCAACGPRVGAFGLGADTPPAFEWLQTTWLGEVFKHQHDIIVRRINADEWYLPLVPNKGSCSLAWPGRLVCAPGYKGEDIFFFEPLQDIRGPAYITIGEHSMWEGRSIVWRSPLWQFLTLPKPWQMWRTKGIRAFCDGDLTLVGDAWVLELGPGLVAAACWPHRL